MRMRRTQVTATLSFDYQILISLSLSPGGCLCQTWRNVFKAFLRYCVLEKRTDRRTTTGCGYHRCRDLKKCIASNVYCTRLEWCVKWGHQTGSSVILWTVHWCRLQTITAPFLLPSLHDELKRLDIICSRAATRLKQASWHESKRSQVDFLSPAAGEGYEMTQQARTGLDSGKGCR